jgi:glucose 1-dehydrogenase
MGVLDDQVALVTGASRGIGRAVALALAEAGAAVAINYRSHPEEAQEVHRQIQASGGRAITLQADVADLPSVEGLVQTTVEEFGRLDIAVSNAAYSVRSLFYEADMKEFRRTVDVTLWGAIHTVKAATNQMLAQGQGGSIVLISSPHAYLAIPQSMAYNLSKAAVDQMAKTAAIELTGHRIRVNIIHPGWIDTPGERRHFSEDEIREGGAKLPWNRLGKPDEVARGAVFLCDPKSDYITGSSLAIDGGISLPWWGSRGSAIPD